MPITPRALVALARVADVERSIGFYRRLGFAVRSTFAPPGESRPAWAEIESSGARLMLARGEPISPERQGVVFYLFCDDVTAARAALVDRGVEAGPIAFPFYAPGGEFRITDPDGYAILVTHT